MSLFTDLSIVGPLVSTATSLLSNSGLMGNIPMQYSNLGQAGQVPFWNIPNPLFGGITPQGALAIHQQIAETKYARRNLFLIEVNSKLSGEFAALNFFATGVDYAPDTVSGEKYRVGAATVDSIQCSDPTELRITTLDDAQGSVKNWFVAHILAEAPGDGTMGLPDDYKIRIRVTHSTVTKPIAKHFENLAYFRAANMELSLSRRESEMEEINMTFVQMDSFISPP